MLLSLANAFKAAVESVAGKATLQNDDENQWERDKIILRYLAKNIVNYTEALPSMAIFADLRITVPERIIECFIILLVGGHHITI